MLLYVFIISLVALLFAAYLAWDVLKRDTGTPAMQNIANAIREGANAFLKRQYKTIAILAIVVAVLIFGVYAFLGKWDYAIKTAFAFVVGAVCSALSGLIGMYISVRANIRTASAARTSTAEALKVAIRGGAVSGVIVVALSLIGVAGLFYLFGANPQTTPFMLVGF